MGFVHIRIQKLSLKDSILRPKIESLRLEMLVIYNVSKPGLLTIYLRFYGHLVILAPCEGKWNFRNWDFPKDIVVSVFQTYGFLRK